MKFQKIEILNATNHSLVNIYIPPKMWAKFVLSMQQKIIKKCCFTSGFHRNYLSYFQ